MSLTSSDWHLFKYSSILIRLKESWENLCHSISFLFHWKRLIIIDRNDRFDQDLLPSNVSRMSSDSDGQNLAQKYDVVEIKRCCKHPQVKIYSNHGRRDAVPFFNNWDKNEKITKYW